MKRFVSLAMAFFMTLGVMKLGEIDVSAAQATGITNEGVYKITNVASGKCINLDYGYDEDGTNIYQWTDDGSVEQKFKVVYDASYNNNNGGYRFYAKSSANGNYRVLDIEKSSGSVVSGCNVEIWKPTDAVAQYFQITQVSSGKYKICPVANTSVALTSYGTSNGSKSGRTSTSAGNIFVSSYTGSNNQLWTFTKLSTANETAYANMAFSFPTSLKSISSGYARRNYDNKFHAGIDIPASLGSSIVSANTGKVVEIFDEPDSKTGRGHCVVIESTSNNVYGTSTKIRTIYMHMRYAPSVSKGSTVTKGSTQIGQVGNTGASGGTHLHYGVISDGSSGGSLTQSRTLNPFWFYPNTIFTYTY